MPSRRYDPSFSSARPAYPDRQDYGIGEPVRQEFEFPEPAMPVANDDDIQFSKIYRSAPRVGPKVPSGLGKALFFLCLIIFSSVAAFTLAFPTAFLSLGITPTLVIVAIIPASMTLLLAIVLTQLQKIIRLLGQNSENTENDFYIQTVHSRVEALDEGITELKRGSILLQDLVSSRLSALEQNFENALYERAERLREDLFNVNSTTYSTAQLIDKRIMEAISLLKETSKENLLEQAGILFQEKINDQIKDIELQLKTLSDAVSRKFYDTGSVKIDFEKLMKSYLDDINKRSDLVIAQLDQAVSRSQDMLDKFKSIGSEQETRAILKKIIDDYSTIEKRVSQTLLKLEQSNQKKLDEIDVNSHGGRSSSVKTYGSSPLQNVEDSKQVNSPKLTTEMLLRAQEEIEGNIYQNQKIITAIATEKNEGEALSDIDGSMNIISDYSKAQKLFKNQKHIPHDQVSSEGKATQATTKKRTNSLLNKIFRR